MPVWGPTFLRSKDSPMALSPEINDKKWNLWFKITSNLYDYAINNGLSGLNPPNWNDPQVILMKKATYISARLADA